MSVQRFVIRTGNERGAALITALLVMMLMSALMIGFTTAVMTEQKSRFVDKDRTRAFYAAQSGLEKLTADLATLFFVNVTPTAGQIDALKDDPPDVPGATFESDGVDHPYGVTAGAAVTGDIKGGPYQGLKALKKEYTLDSAVKTDSGGEAHLVRRIETVAIPVFQFGIFSDVDLSFSAAAEYDFGGRVHTNRNLFLAQGGSGTLWLRDRVTAVGEIVRQRLSNGNTIASSGSTQPVKVATAPGAFRTLAATEGSVVDGLGSAANTSWSTLSLSTYNGYLRTGKTGAKPLNLPLITTGGINYDLIKRPVAGEDGTNPTLLAERNFTRVSLRILLSDTANDIVSLPGVTSQQPVRLDGDWATTVPNNGTAYGPIDLAHPPIARSPGLVTATVSAQSPAGQQSSATITTAALPIALRFPALTVTRGGTPGSPWTVYCTGRTPSTFTGCVPQTPPGATVASSTTTMTGTYFNPEANANVAAMGGGTAMTAPWASPWTTITVNSAATNAFSTMFPTTPKTFFVEKTNGTNLTVTCTGGTTTTLTGCNIPSPGLVNGDIITNGAQVNHGISQIGGFIKVELQDSDNIWHDVTMEFLNYGIADKNLGGKACSDPTPNAILRIQRLKDNNESGGGLCSYTTTTRSTDYWPNTLFDTREGVFREGAAGPTGTVQLSGVIQYISLDVRNLSRWFDATAPYGTSIGPTGLKNNNGFSVYFSDRRSNRNASNQETGEFGFEDEVNPASSTGAPNGTLDTGEDVNADNVLQTYGKFPSWDGTRLAVPSGVPAGSYFNNATVVTDDVRATRAQVNRAYFFRRGLKLINGGLGNIVQPGLTIVAENPVYIQGDYNASQAGWGTGSAATSVVADAVTMLSNSWNDNNSFSSPYLVDGRPRGSDTWVRTAIIAGKGPLFPNPAGASATFGTDGGAHSFLRFLEGAAGNNMVHYRGSLVTFYYQRQAVSPFKCCGGIVYDVPSREYSFDQNFLDLGLLPPLTPVFRDLNALGFTQETRPGH